MLGIYDTASTQKDLFWVLLMTVGLGISQSYYENKVCYFLYVAGVELGKQRC